MVATLYPGACLVDQTSTSVTSPGIVVEYNTITSEFNIFSSKMETNALSVEENCNMIMLYASAFPKRTTHSNHLKLH